MLSLADAGVVNAVVVTAAFTLMGRSHSKQIKNLTKEWADERRTLINHALSGTAFEFAARQRATEAPPEPVTPRPTVRQLDV